MSPLDRLREHRARVIARRLDEYGEKYGRYYRVAVAAGEGMFLDGKASPTQPKQGVVLFDPEASRRRRREQTAHGLMEAIRLGIWHGWTDAEHRAQDGLERLEEYANGTASELEVDER